MTDSEKKEGYKKPWVRRPMIMLTHFEARKAIEDAGLHVASVNGVQDIVVIKKNDMGNTTMISWDRFFAILDARKIAVFQDSVTGYLKIMGQKHQRFIS